MKRIAFVFAIVTALFAFNACERQEVEELKSFDHLTFTSAKPEVEDAFDTKTGWNGTAVQWLKGDKIRIGFTLDDVWQSSGKLKEDGITYDNIPRFYVSDELDDDATNASFSVPFGPNYFQESIKELKGDIVFYGIYPSGACDAGQSNAPNVHITIPDEQRPSANSFDSSADILVGCSETLPEITEDPILMNWNRVVALADITLKELNVVEGESLLRVTLTAQEGANLVGDYTLNLLDGSVSGNGGNEISLNVSGLSIGSDNTLKVWAGFLPETVTYLKVVLTTDAATYTKTIDKVNGKNLSLSFVKNKRNILGIKMGDAIREGKVVDEFALRETSNVELVAETDGNASEATVNGNDAIKVGSSSKGGYMSVIVPAGSTKLHLHAAAWNGVTGLSLNITGATTNPSSLALNADAGISGNSPYALSGSVDDFYYTIDLSEINEETVIKFTSSTSKRFVVWGVNVEPEPKVTTWALDGIEVTTAPTKTEYVVGECFDPTGMIVSASYVDAEDESNTKSEELSIDEISFSPSLETELALTDSKITLSYGGKSAEVTITVSEPSETNGFTWNVSGITTGYSFIVENGALKESSYYQDKNSTTGLDLLYKKSDDSALFIETPTSIRLKVTVGGGSAKDPLEKSVYAYLVDNNGNNINSTMSIITSKVENKTGKEYTINMPLVETAFGVRISHAKESGYNVRIYKVELSIN